MSRDWAGALHMTPMVYLAVPLLKVGAALAGLFGAGVLVGMNRKGGTS